MALDGRIIELKDLEEALWARRDRFTLMHPGQLFDRRLVVMCARGTPRERIDPALAAALRAGYERPALAFVKQESTERPLFGRRTRLLTTTAAFTLVASADQAEEGASVVDNYRGCIDLAAHLVVRRRQGKNVALVVGK